jgi:ribonuclease HI
MSVPQEENIPEVQLFADGACSGNPGPGGCAFILRHVATGRERKRSVGNAKLPTTAWS